MDTVKTPEVDNQWPADEQLDVDCIVQALGPHAPSGVAFYADEGLPWVEVHYDLQIVRPERVVPIGEAIEKSIKKPVLFQALRPSSICYLIDVDPGSLTDDKNAPFLRAGEYGVRLDELKKGWKGGG